MNTKPLLIDGHVHYQLPFEPGKFINILNMTGTDMACVAAMPHNLRLSCVPDALMLKMMYPGRFFVFACLDASVYFLNRGRVGEKMAAYAKKILACGCDGIKLIESKPNMRRLLPVPDWDDPVWDPFFSFCEAEQVPILWHVNDPETFWDAANAPAWAVARGWLYDGSYINNEAQYSQIFAVLEAHPRLRIDFAHFFFMSAQLERLSGFLDRYPNVMIDLTPGSEMYMNFSRNIENAAAFFEKYTDRIIYGTDIGGRNVLGASGPVSAEESLSRVKLVQTFLREKGSADMPGDDGYLSKEQAFTMECLGLDEETLSKITGGNFLRFTGKESAAPDARATLRECRRIIRRLRLLGLTRKGFRPDTACVKQVMAYIKERLHDN